MATIDPTGTVNFLGNADTPAERFLSGEATRLHRARLASIVAEVAQMAREDGIARRFREAEAAADLATKALDPASGMEPGRRLAAVARWIDATRLPAAPSPGRPFSGGPGLTHAAIARIARAVARYLFTSRGGGDVVAAQLRLENTDTGRPLGAWCCEAVEKVLCRAIEDELARLRAEDDR